KPDRDLDVAEIDPWGLGESSEGAAFPKSTHDIRKLYLRWRDRAGMSAPDTSRRGTDPSRVRARVQSSFPFDRRIVAGLGLFGVVCALLIGLSRYDFAPSIKTVSGTTYNTAVERLASAVNAALDLVGTHPVGSITP